MVPTLESVSKRLVSSSAAGYSLTAKLYRVLQVLPSAVGVYGIFGDQTLYLASNLEQIDSILPTLNIPNTSAVLQQIDKLIDFTDDAYDELKEALPSRPYDGAEVDLVLPFDSPALEDQIEALQVVATLTVAILQLSRMRSETANVVPASSRLAESIVMQLKNVTRDMKCSQPRESKRRGSALKRAKTHASMIKFLDELLLVAAKDVTSADEQDEGSTTKSEDDHEPKDTAKQDEAPIDGEEVKLAHYGAHPKEDGMPEYVRHNPDNVYAKVPAKDVDPRSLIYYNLPYSKAKENPNFYIIWKQMEPWETENVFQHTKKLRINEQHATIQPKSVVKHLLEKWLAVSIDDHEESSSDEMEELEKNLAELRAQDEKRSNRTDRPIVHSRTRSWSPASPLPRYRTPLRPRTHAPYYSSYRPGETSKTEYWRSWEDQPATLGNALKYAGWQVVYMRGTDAGQTWFYGQHVIHVRRFTDEYVPQDRPYKPDDDDSQAQYLIIGTEWLEEEALHRHGFQFELLPSGHYSLDPRLTWGDIEALVYVSSAFREERLYRKFRTGEKGDLFEPPQVAIPDINYINGSLNFERPLKSRAPTGGTRHVPNRLETMPEELSEGLFKKRQEIVTPVESHDSFVEINR